ncbi:hypothetical protein KFE98_20915 [bacterium SCSIO 12741]|nr:hypothetical protein KFE98_20915 [bacterium SCSIO 12741]
MKRLAVYLMVAIPLAVASCSTSFSKSQNMENNKQETVYEIAVFRVKDNSGFTEANQKAIDVLSEFDGYLSSRTFQNLADPMIYMDMAEWASLDQAKAAQKQFEKSGSPEIANYLQNMEKVTYFAHLKDIHNGQMHFRATQEGDILEFALGHVASADRDNYYRTRIEVLNQIGGKYDFIREVQTLQSIEDETQFLDLLRWESAEKCEKVQSDLQEDPIYLDFASNFDMNKEMIMQFYRQIR